MKRVQKWNASSRSLINSFETRNATCRGRINSFETRNANQQDEIHHPYNSLPPPKNDSGLVIFLTNWGTLALFGGTWGTLVIFLCFFGTDPVGGWAFLFFASKSTSRPFKIKQGGQHEIQTQRNQNAHTIGHQKAPKRRRRDFWRQSYHECPCQNYLIHLKRETRQAVEFNHMKRETRGSK